MSSTSDARVRPTTQFRKPVLLDRLPGSFLASPGFVAAAAGGTILYGLAFAVVWSGIAKDRAQARQVAQQTHAQPVEPSPVVPLSPIPPTVATNPTPSPTPAALNPTPTPTPAPAGTTQVATVAQPSPTPTPTTAPKVEEPPKPPPQPERDASALGALVDPTGKSQLVRDGADLTLKIPGKLCFLNSAAKLDTSPRALTGIEGNFDLVVRVSGDDKDNKEKLKPGADAVKNAPLGPNGMPFSFNGVGLVIWRDLDNFLRLESAAGTQNGRNIFPVVVLEAWKDGKIVTEDSPNLPGGPLSLKIERRGGTWNCSYSADGQAWTPLKEVTVDYGDRVEVGILGSNTSRKAFSARFEGFRLSPR